MRKSLGIVSTLLETRETPKRTVMLLADVLATGEWEKEVIREKSWQEEGETECDSLSFRGVGHLCSSACSSRCWIIYSTQEAETKIFFFLHFLFQWEKLYLKSILYDFWKKNTPTGIAGSCVLGILLCK